ncbi:ketopantoate reductase family protein [Streptomyces sp. NPDC056361]|uniref:ketopantoate reductase family protein n=1 Tax=Streptomyces sp. NPDC056361 TaxID=3345795 RepID=UPI0035DEDAF4
MRYHSIDAARRQQRHLFLTGQSTHVQDLTLAQQWHPLDGVATVLHKVVARLRAMPPESGSSMLWVRLAGREMEYDARNGAVVRAGAQLGIPTRTTRLSPRCWKP